MQKPFHRRPRNDEEPAGQEGTFKTENSTSLRGLARGMQQIERMFPPSRSKLNTTTNPENHIPRRIKAPNLDSMRRMGGWVYITCSLNHSTLYTGVTSNIASRIYKHKHKFYSSGFSAKYNCIKLVYYRRFESIIEAITEEKRLKAGSRKKKEDLINSINPEWKDLYDEIKYL